MSALAALKGPSAYWYLTRGTGVVSLLLLTASVVLGIMGSLRFVSAPRWPRFAIDSLHRDVSLLVIAVLLVHIGTSVLDSFAPIRLIDAVVPLVSTYRPLWLGLGALSFDLLVALVITSLVRRRLGYGAWRAIHWLAYASWPVAVTHGLGTGTDVKSAWMLALTLACLAAVLVAIFMRIGAAAPRARVLAYAASVATPLALASFTFVGPLQKGWARRAGTPASLFGKPARPVVIPVAAAVVPPHDRLKAPFSARLSGKIVQTNEPGGAILDIALKVSGGANGRLRVRMAGAPLPDGSGLSMVGSQVDLTAVGLTSAMEGRIVSLEGQQFLARVADANGTALDLRANLNIDAQTGAVTGTLSATPTGR
jgi:sulfoxide reductase heme-binding subunit YedZ